MIGVGGSSPTNPSFSRIFNFFFNLTRPLILRQASNHPMISSDIETRWSLCARQISSLEMGGGGGGLGYMRS